MIALIHEKQITEWQQTLRGAPLPQVIQWACETFAGRLIVATSMGPEDMVIIDAIAALHCAPRLVCLDTGLLFPETLRLTEMVRSRYQLTVTAIWPAETVEVQAAHYGPRLWERDPDQCCRLRKVEPLQRTLAGAEAWVTGIRRSQSPTRRAAETVEWDPVFSLVKINPLAFWSNEDVWDYIRANNVPYNPLHDQGYPSIGCMPCTRPSDGSDERSGRWAGSGKTECGLHR